jgi:HK97 family phage prohead protease
VPFRLDKLETSGEFTGYASVFDNMDWYGDVVRPGAFTKSIAKWKAQGKLPPLLWQHNSQCPIGPHLDMYEDAKGLYVHAKLLVDDIQLAKEAYALLKAKVISGMSIGYDVAANGANYDGKTNVWNLVELDLWENSLATFPANEEAQVDEVKNLLAGGRLPTPSEFEKFLRDAGFSRKQATRIASCGYTSLRDAALPLRDAEDDDEVKAIDSSLTELVQYLNKRA